MQFSWGPTCKPLFEMSLRDKKGGTTYSKERRLGYDLIISIVYMNSCCFVQPFVPPFKENRPTDVCKAVLWCSGREPCFLIFLSSFLFFLSFLYLFFQEKTYESSCMLRTIFHKVEFASKLTSLTENPLCLCDISVVMRKD